MFNQQVLIGNVGSDAQLNMLPSGAQVVNFSMATNHSWKRQDGEWEQETEWFRVDVWGQQAAGIAEKFKRGTMVCVIGRLSTEEFTDKNGQTRTSLKVRGSRAFALPKGTCPQCGYSQSQNQTQQNQEGNQPQGQSPAVYNPASPPASETAPAPSYGDRPVENDLEDLPW